MVVGIADMSAAIGLRQAGWQPVIVERAPERRKGGYFIGLMAEGRQAAADLEAALWQGIRGDGMDERFATTPAEIDDTATEVGVLLEDTATGERHRENFDLVNGADGLRSGVRRMAFGPHEDHMTKWDAMTCAFQLDEQVSSSFISAPAGRAVWVFGFADRPPRALLTYRTENPEEQFIGSKIERLRAVCSGMDDPLRLFIRKHQRIARLKQQMFVPPGRPAEAIRSVVPRFECTARERRAAKARAAEGSMS